MNYWAIIMNDMENEYKITNRINSLVCARSYSRQVGNILRVKMFAGRAYCGSPSLPKVGGDSPAMSGDK